MLILQVMDYACAEKRNIEVHLSYKQLRIGCLQVQESTAEAFADADTEIL